MKLENRIMKAKCKRKLQVSRNNDMKVKTKNVG